MNRKSVARTTRSHNKKALPPHVVIRKKKLRDGTSETYWAVRLFIPGRTLPIQRACKTGSPTDAADVYKRLQEEHAHKTPRQIENRNRTFGELADYFERVHLVPAEFSNGEKNNRGRRKVKGPLGYLNGQLKVKPEHRKFCKGPDLGLRTLIGEKTRLNSITWQRLIEIKEYLFKVPPAIQVIKRTKREEKLFGPAKRSHTDVDRRFEILRKMFNVARKDLGWMTVDPFKEGTETIIEKSKEKSRIRILKFEEEALLHEAAMEEREITCRHCKSIERPEDCAPDKHNGARVKDREHLRLIVTGLLDTCMRSSEFFQLTVGDWRTHEIEVQQWTTKMLKARTVPSSDRFTDLIRKWIADNELTDDDWLLTRRSVRKNDKRRDREGMDDHIKGCRTGWRTLLKLTGLQDLRPRDLRRTGATRLLRAGMPLAEISQILGHTDIKMTMKYIGVDNMSMVRANKFLNEMHQQHAAELAPNETVATVN